MLCLEDYEEYAKKHLDRKTWIFYSQGGEREFTLKDNIRSFTRYTLIPRMLLNSQQRDLSTTVLGQKISIPIGIAPTAFQRLAHPDGEIASFKAAEQIGTIFTLSTVSNTSLEDVANAIPNHMSPLWMQLYMTKNRSENEKLIRKAEANGYKAIVFTVDTPVTGLQLKLWRQGGLKLPPHLGYPNIQLGKIKAPNSNEIPNHIELIKTVFDCDINWEDVTWIKSVTKLPLVLKGILTAEDAIKAHKYGAAAVWVSNHGGRQLDCVDASIDALPEIVAALDGSGCEVYMDGGIRWGSDVLKALALGARAVFIGRPALWGLAHSGQKGVRNVLEILKSELDRAMHLSGCQSVEDIGRYLVKQNLFSKI